MKYCCPDPTPEQLKLGLSLGYDPYDRCGDGFTDTSPCDVLCAACLIHDELFLIGGPIDAFHSANANFSRDCFILAKAQMNYSDQAYIALRALEYVTVIHLSAWQFWKNHDRNTDKTRAQGASFMVDAKKWINQCALKLEREIPYPEVA